MSFQLFMGWWLGQVFVKGLSMQCYNMAEKECGVQVKGHTWVPICLWDMTWGRIVVHWTFSLLVLNPSDTLLYILNGAMGGPGSFSTVILVISKHIFYLVVIIKSEVPILSRCLWLGNETSHCEIFYMSLARGTRAKKRITGPPEHWRVPDLSAHFFPFTSHALGLFTTWHEN